MPANSAREVIDWAQQLANRVDPGWRERARLAVSRALKKWAEAIPWPGLRTTEDFVVSGDRKFVFPERVGAIVEIFDKTNNRCLGTTGNWGARTTGVYGQDTGGNAREWEDKGWTPFTAQPATDTALELAAGGSEAFEVRVTGYVRDAAASGTALELQERYEILTMGGTNYTATSTVWASFLGLEKEFGTTNWLKARNPLTSQVISYIPPGEATAQQRSVDFIPIPTAGTEIRVTYYRVPEQIHSEDFPIDNSVDLEYLAWQAAGDLHWMLKEGSAARAAWAKAQEKMADRLKQQNVMPTHKATRPAFTYTSLELPWRYYNSF